MAPKDSQDLGIQFLRQFAIGVVVGVLFAAVLGLFIDQTHLTTLWILISVAACILAGVMLRLRYAVYIGALLGALVTLTWLI